ncbi:MAG: patatin-like phospholipase family protein [Candidatus Nanopelagicales bacterium]|nr:patatin-like phospholipase family protein [Candidatus Nanopelagicales bacterium]MDZ4248887.1 patatin-like phospholipase family protein [Candidatus Nanopelagicales bacterium]
MTQDGLAVSISFEARYGAGQDRTLVLGGGGLFFVAWQVAYLHELDKAGVRLNSAEVVVGTSAGSLIAAVLTAGRLGRLAAETAFMSKRPSLLAALAPASGLNESQLRAVQMFREATNADPVTVRGIGHAALAADTPSSAQMRRHIGLVVAKRVWPSPALKISTVDAFSGQRLIITDKAGVSPVRAVAASSAVPGLFSPQPLLDRRCMDGGVSGTGSHCDVVAGSGRALVISMLALSNKDYSGMTNAVGGFDREVSALAETGTRVMARGPEHVEEDELMSPTSVVSAMSQGRRQAIHDLPEVAAFWGS